MFGFKKDKQNSGGKPCDDQCDNCMYVGEGTFMCAVDNEIVIDEWMPIKGTCDKED